MATNAAVRSSIEVLNPVAQTSTFNVAPAARPTSLAEATIGLFWNMKPGGDSALRTIARELSARHPGLRFNDYVGSVGSSVKYATPEDQVKMAAECDVVIGSTGDCGGCTSWLVTSMIGIEERGCPTVSVVAETFVDDAERTAASLGLDALPLLVMSSGFTNRTEEEIAAMVAPAIDRLEELIHAEVPATDLSSRVQSAAVEAVDGEDALDAFSRFNELFIERGWSDGLPLVPPTRAAVDRMLAGTSLSPDTVIAKALYPGLGVATVEKIAINGVMAGCLPQHMPVLVALVKAYDGHGMLGKTQAISTGPNAPMIMVSGPIVERLGFNSRTCGLGPGSPSRVNTVIGRALRLILMNIGQAYPGVLDMDTIGSSNKYSLCVAENREASPWSWNVFRGYPEDVDLVSIALVYPGVDIYDITATRPEEMLDTVVSLTGSYRGTASTGRWLFGGRQDPVTKKVYQEHHVLLLAPSHASLLARHGWSVARLQEYLHSHSRIAFRELCTNILRPQGDALKLAHPELAWLLDQPETKVGITQTAECYEVFVTGGETGRSQFYYGGSEVSSAVVEA